MVYTDEFQVAPGPLSLARTQHSPKRSVLFYNLRRFKKSKSQGGPSRRGNKGGERAPPARDWLPVSPGSVLDFGPYPVESPGFGSSTADFGQNPAGCPGPVPAVILGDLSRALAILQSVRDALLGPADSLPSVESSSECASRARLLEELSASNRECPLCGSLLSLLELLAEENPGAVPAGEVMPEPVAPGDVAAALDLRGNFGSGDAKVTEDCYAAPTAAESRFPAPTVRGMCGSGDATVAEWRFSANVVVEGCIAGGGAAVGRGALASAASTVAESALASASSLVAAAAAAGSALATSAVAAAGSALATSAARRPAVHLYGPPPFCGGFASVAGASVDILLTFVVA